MDELLFKVLGYKFETFMLFFIFFSNYISLGNLVVFCMLVHTYIHILTDIVTFLNVNFSDNSVVNFNDSNN